MSVIALRGSFRKAAKTPTNTPLAVQILLGHDAHAQWEGTPVARPTDRQSPPFTRSPRSIWAAQTREISRFDEAAEKEVRLSLSLIAKKLRIHRDVLRRARAAQRTHLHSLGRCCAPLWTSRVSLRIGSDSDKCPRLQRPQ